MVFNVLSLYSLTKNAIANMFWEESWISNRIELKNDEQTDEIIWQSQLISCREGAIESVRIFFEKEIYPYFFDLIEEVDKLFRVYHQLFWWKRTYDPQNKINLLEKGPLYAPNFSISTGKFNDYIWAKRFVSNTRYNLLTRFGLACLYWLEDESKSLWFEIKRIYIYHSNTYCPRCYRYLLENTYQPHKEFILCMIIHLRIILIAQDDNVAYPDNFFKSGFLIALEGGYEYALYYFWNEMPNDQKLSIMESDNFFDMLSLGTAFPYDLISYFLFSKLSQERINDLTEWTRNNGKFQPWYNRLFTDGAESPYSIIKYIPVELYYHLFDTLIYRITIFQSKVDITIFTAFIMSLNYDDIEIVLDTSTFCIENLAHPKLMHVLETFISRLSLQQKENILLQDLYGGGITVLDYLSQQEEFDLIHKYLCMFLMDTQSSKKTLRTDAALLLEKFSRTPRFLKWCEDEEYANQSNVLINSIHQTVTLLNEVCDIVSNKNNNDTNDFSRSEDLDLTIYSSSTLKRKIDEKLKSAKLHKKC